MIENKLQIYETAETLSKAVAEFILLLAQNAVKQKGRFTLVLSGGNTPEKLFSILAHSPFKEQLPWKHIFIFWGDERYVPRNDERNNSNRAYHLLINRINIPEDNIFPIPVNVEPSEAARQYEKTILRFFATETPSFDLVLLGLGKDGHTASLFPKTALLHESSALVKEVYAEEQKMFRITMMAPLINLAHNILFLVAGKEKAAILKAVTKENNASGKYPAQLIHPVNGRMYWFVDKDAAHLLVADSKVQRLDTD